MSLLKRLVDLARIPDASHDDVDTSGVSDERLAAAALLVHVARVDGIVAETERQALFGFLTARFGVSDRAAEALLARAGRLDREVDDVAGLIELMGHGLDEQDRARLLASAYRIAAADGSVLEFEDDLVWRVGHLLGFDDAAIGAIRSDAIGEAAVRRELLGERQG